MDKSTKDDIKEILESTINPLIVEFKAAHDAHEKEIEKLIQQTLENTENIRNMDDKRQKQVLRCQSNNTEKQEKTGVRIGLMENLLTRMDEHIKSNTGDLLKIAETFKTLQERKDFNITQMLVVLGLVVLIVFEIIPIIKGA